uniref:RRM domain-containing protein n=1 Tax=Parastrongyloides trichosuri TaxID=131310 RepID=A0A0N4Z9B8_PARTI
MGEDKEEISDKESVKSRSRTVSRSSRSGSSSSSRSRSSSSRSSESSRSSSGRSSSRSSDRSATRSRSSSRVRSVSRERKKSYSRSRSRSPRRSSDRYRSGKKYSPRRRSPDRRRRSRSRSYTRKNRNKRLVIRDITQNVTKEHIKEIFDNYGSVTHIDMVPPTRYEGTAHRGYCFIEYDDPEDAQKAVKYMNNGWLDGRKIRVDLSIPKNVSKRFNSPPRRRYSSPRRDFGRRRYSRSPR